MTREKVIITRLIQFKSPHVRGRNSLTESQKRLLRKEAQHRYYLKTKGKKKIDNAKRYEIVKQLLRPTVSPSPNVYLGFCALDSDSPNFFQASPKAFSVF